MKKGFIAILLATQASTSTQSIGDILTSTNKEAYERINQEEKKKSDYGNLIWEMFWKCPDFNFDYSDPNDYRIIDGKCEYTPREHN